MDSVIYLRPDLLSAFGGTGGLHPSSFALASPAWGTLPPPLSPHLPSCRGGCGWGPSVAPKGVRPMGRQGRLIYTSPLPSRPPLCARLFLRVSPARHPPPRTAPLIARTPHLQVKLHLVFLELTCLPSSRGFSAVSSSCLSLQEEGAGAGGLGPQDSPLTSPAPSPHGHQLGAPSPPPTRSWLRARDTGRPRPAGRPSKGLAHPNLPTSRPVPGTQQVPGVELHSGQCLIWKS